MTIHKVAGIDAGGYADYLAASDAMSRRGDYYLGVDGHTAGAPGIWLGAGAAALDLQRDVTQEDLIATWEGRDPRTGDVLIQRGSTGERVAATCRQTLRPVWTNHCRSFLAIISRPSAM